MSQNLSEKCEAIISLLEFVWFHLDFVPGAMHVQQYGESEGGAGHTVIFDPNCSGRCFTCLAYHKSKKQQPLCPPEERWVWERIKLRRRYRMREIEEALIDLSKSELSQAQAVWAVYVEPWPDPKAEPISERARRERQTLADQGVVWLAHSIKGEIVAYGERPNPRDNQIRQLAAQGYTRRRIAKEVGCSLRDVVKVLSADESAVSDSYATAGVTM
jgi:hypothetical protein